MGRSRTRTGFDLLQYRVRMLPIQLERARKRVEHLEVEAIRLGLKDLAPEADRHKRLFNDLDMV